VPSPTATTAGAPLAGVRRIAVLRANALGDYLFSLPALDALRAAYPAAEITLLGAPWQDALAGSGAEVLVTGTAPEARDLLGWPP
jgi:hypothetical protein